MKVRSARRSDVPAIAAIERESFSDPWAQAAFEDALDWRGSKVLIIENDSGNVAGYAVLRILAGEAELLNLAIASHSRRRGLARRLVDEVCRLSREGGSKILYLEVREANDAAKALYKHLGFSEMGRRKGYYRQPTEDALILCKEPP